MKGRIAKKIVRGLDLKRWRKWPRRTREQAVRRALPRLSPDQASKVAIGQHEYFSHGTMRDAHNVYEIRDIRYFPAPKPLTSDEAIFKYEVQNG